ncbi:MAG: NAD(P)-dependent oxidoreductase [Gammaproteobacteria bacterium]|nr:NAD(P)-dependent oxidoreductase [Gammaproteobacteria bacterium]
MADALASGQAASPQVTRNARRMASDDHERNVLFTPVLRVKDMGYALELATQLGIGCPVGSLAAEQYRQLCELGHGSANESKVIEVARHRSAGGSRAVGR